MIVFFYSTENDNSLQYMQNQQWSNTFFDANDHIAYYDWFFVFKFVWKEYWKERARMHGTFNHTILDTIIMHYSCNKMLLQ